MVSKKILSYIVASFVLAGTLPAFANGNPNVTTQPPASSNRTSNASNNDGVVSDAVCDPSIFARIKQKGWMEAQRENYINQSIIKRPVNTFAATCFDKQLGLSMGSLGVQEDDDNNPSTNPSTGKSKTKFEQGVANSSGATVRALIGPLSNGKPLLPTSGVGSETTTYDEYEEDPASTTGSFDCNAMNQIWDNVTCENMAGSDMPSLGEVSSGNDARSSGTKSCTTGTSDRSTDQASNIYSFTSGQEALYSPVEGDNALDLHLCKTLPYSQLKAAGCPETCSSFQTGIDPSRGKGIQCSNPGCVPNSDSTSCVPQR